MVDQLSTNSQTTLVGKRAKVRPLREIDFEPLCAVASEPDIWAIHPFRDCYKNNFFKRNLPRRLRRLARLQ